MAVPAAMPANQPQSSARLDKEAGEEAAHNRRQHLQNPYPAQQLQLNGELRAYQQNKRQRAQLDRQRDEFCHRRFLPAGHGGRKRTSDEAALHTGCG